ncbi:MAG: L,D-transpeptidase family protein [Nevskiales bacterium]
MRTLALAMLAALVLAGGIFAYGWYAAQEVDTKLPRADRVLVDKSDRRLSLMRSGEVIKTYRISLGGNPSGHKQREGDERTPEGLYKLNSRNSRSRFFRSLHISYPNAEDRAQARAQGVSPGGDIMLHGSPNGWGWLAGFLALWDWTDGCIAVHDGAIQEIWQAVPDGTPIEIRP